MKNSRPRICRSVSNRTRALSGTLVDGEGKAASLFRGSLLDTARWFSRRYLQPCVSRGSTKNSEKPIGGSMFMSTWAYLSGYRLAIDDVAQHPQRTPDNTRRPGRMRLSLAYRAATPFDSCNDCQHPVNYVYSLAEALNCILSERSIRRACLCAISRTPRVWLRGTWSE